MNPSIRLASLDPGAREEGLRILGEFGLVLAGEAGRIEPALALDGSRPALDSEFESEHWVVGEYQLRDGRRTKLPHQFNELR
jgi:hypothetical protein